MRNGKEIAQLLKDALENQDSDAIWYVIGELERGEDIASRLVAKRADLIKARELADQGAPLAANEYDASDDYYLGGINAIDEVLGAAVANG